MVTSTQFKIGVAAVLILIVLVFAFNRWNAKRSNFQWPVPAGSTTVATEVAADSAFQTALNSCQDTYNQELIAAGTNTTAQLAAETKRAGCIKTASGTYVTARCPVSDGRVPTDSATLTLYNRYQTDIIAVQQAYVTSQRLIASTDVGFLTAARKSDMAGATRRYIASACPAFYKPTAATDPDPTATYAAWSTGETVTNGFKPSLVTVASITAWADYAAIQYSVAEYFKYATAVAAATTLGPIKLSTVSGLVVGDAVQLAYKTTTTVTAGVESAPLDGLANGTIATVNAATNQITVTLPAATATGVVLPVDAVIAKALKGGNANSKWKFAGSTTNPNWKLARDFGPGSLPVPTWAIS